MPNINSFTETVNTLVEQVNVALNSVVKYNKSITTQEDTISLSVDQINPLTGDPSTVTYSLPSFTYVVNKLNSLAETMDAFVNGEGVVLLNDGTYRKVSTQPVAISPPEITNVSAPGRFSTRSNWFFESMMFPQLIVSFDLKNKIDDQSDRVVVKRVIFDNTNDEETEWFLDNIVGTNRTYYETITYLTEQGKAYWEDEETQYLPLAAEPYYGYFVITDKRTISGSEWYYLDTMNYGETSDEPIVKNYQLSTGDFLRYGNSIWKIDDINISEKRVKIIPYVGTTHPTVNNRFEIYTAPFETKILQIPIGYNECNIIFLKGVNENFNILGDDWGYGIPFWTNTLVSEGGSISLEDYYIYYVSDFGKHLEGQAKERFIPAYFGLIPNAPQL